MPSPRPIPPRPQEAATSWQPSSSECPTCLQTIAQPTTSAAALPVPPPRQQKLPSSFSLGSPLRRKQQQITAQLAELGTEGLEERLQSATEAPAPNPFRLAQLVAVRNALLDYEFFSWAIFITLHSTQWTGQHFA